jgi:hypothetical protein
MCMLACLCVCVHVSGCDQRVSDVEGQWVKSLADA